VSDVIGRVRAVVSTIVEAFLDEVAQLTGDYALLEDDDIKAEFKAFVVSEGNGEAAEQ